MITSALVSWVSGKEIARMLVGALAALIFLVAFNELAAWVDRVRTRRRTKRRWLL
jgi:hypothetical protein